MNNRKSLLRKLRPYLYILPSFIFLFLFTYYPIARSLYMSFFDWGLSSTHTFIGVENYRWLLEDSLFWRVLRNNLVYAGVSIPFAVGLGLIAAIIVDQRLKRSTFYRAAFFTPTMIPMAAASMVWVFILTPNYGLLNYYLQKIGLPNIEWLGDSRYALSALIIVGVWKYMGYYMILLLAGLQNIPTELYEAGLLEGATGWKKFRWITLPLLAPTLFFTLIMAIINSFQSVDQIYLMTKGGPANSTNMLVYYIYQYGLRFWDMGYAATLTTVLFTILLVITVLAFGVVNRRIHYS